jgi:hypothetical protein
MKKIILMLFTIICFNAWTPSYTQDAKTLADECITDCMKANTYSITSTNKSEEFVSKAQKLYTKHYDKAIQSIQSQNVQDRLSIQGKYHYTITYIALQLCRAQCKPRIVYNVLRCMIENGYGFDAQLFTQLIKNEYIPTCTDLLKIARTKCDTDTYDKLKKNISRIVSDKKQHKNHVSLKDLIHQYYALHKNNSSHNENDKETIVQAIQSYKMHTIDNER